VEESTAIEKQALPAKREITPGHIRIGLILLALVIIAAVGIFAYVKIKAWIKQKKDRKKVHYEQGGGVVSDDFDANSFGSVMFNAMNGPSADADTKEAAAAQLTPLNDNELRAIHNDWNRPGSFYDRFGETLYQMMSAEWVTGYTQWDLLLNRLSKLGLTTSQ
jgi:hypothetical protein